MAEYNEQCKKCFHFQVCAQVMKNQLFIREKMLKEENPKCEHFVNAADVTEVRHGKWEKMFNNPNDGLYCCSECHHSIDIATGRETPITRGMFYCPNCGAKMSDERKDGETE